MLITTLASLVAALLFLAAMLVATLSDIRSRRVPNWLMGVLTLSFAPLALAAGIDSIAVVLCFGVSALILAAGLYGFSRGWVAAGDVKLGAAVSLWLGAELVPGFVLLASFFVLLTLLAARVGMRLSVKTGRGTASLPDDGLPFGPAIAAAGLLLFQISPLAANLS